MATHRDHLLLNLLRPLVEEWRRAEIEEALSFLFNEQAYLSEYPATLHYSGGKTPSKHKVGRSRRSAVDMAYGREVADQTRQLLIELARRYENKEFLPSIGDVRYFLQMRGRDASNLNQRPDAFKKVLDLLIELPDDFLEEILRDKLFSGPSDLGPLSDAINAVGSARRKKGEYQD